MEQAVWQLTALASSRPNWPYALVQFNGDTHHVPLPKEGHLCVLTEEGTNSATCRQITQLEVHLLLLSHLQVVYPAGLNGYEASTIVSLPESLARGANLLGGEPIYLKVGIPQSMAEVSEMTALPSGIHPSTPMASPIKATLPKVEEEVSMTTEVRELLTQVGLDMSRHWLMNSTPKRLNPVVVLTPLPHKLGNISSPVDISSQVGALDDTELGEASLEEIPAVPLPLAKTPGPNGNTSPMDTRLLHEEANRVLGDLLATKSSIKAHQQKLIWELSMALHQNDSKTTESIKETKANSNKAVKEAKATCAKAVKEAKATCTKSI